MKVLVTAATKYGATGEIAQGIGEVALRVPDGDFRDWTAGIADALRSGP